jgi:hypothetical protein
MFTIIGGDGASMFAIGPSSGQVTVSNASLQLLELLNDLQGSNL